MIRHAGLSTALSIPALPVAMIEPRLRALAIAAVGASVLLEPCVLAALQAAVAMTAVTMSADKERRAAFAAEANSQTENHFAV